MSYIMSSVEGLTMDNNTFGLRREAIILVSVEIRDFEIMITI